MSHVFRGTRSSLLTLCWVVAAGLSACGKDDPAPAAVDTPDAGSANSGAAGEGSGDGGEGGSGDDSSCTPGETRACDVDLLCAGEQACSLDGSFGECVCGGVPITGGGVVGATCESDTDCAGGARCMTAGGTDYRGAGGPAGGYCTFDCTEPADCEALDPLSTCVGAGPNGGRVCFRTCLSKDPEPGEAKCLNRPDLVCNSVAALGVEVFNNERQDGVCAPRCGSDAECPEGRVCHRQGGVCTPLPAPGSSSGARCEFDNDCDGQMCENRDDEGIGTCTAPCVAGVLSGCGFASDAPVREVACLSVLVAAGGFSEGIGDVGVCRELCDVVTDCQRANDGFICRELRPESAAFFGRSGACTNVE
jgi:hypothetical protein